MELAQARTKTHVGGADLELGLHVAMNNIGTLPKI